MKFTTPLFLALALFVLSASAKPIKPIKALGDRILTPAQARNLKRRIAAAGGCNANLCFAIDGSGSIPPQDFENEKNFVHDLATLISTDYPAELAAVQFATATTPVSPLTADTEGFNLKVAATEQIKGLSFLRGGLNYCISQVLKRRTEAMKIIVLGDGGSDLGGNAIRRANWFRRIGGDISVVAAGKPNDEVLSALAGGDEKKVFEVKSFFDIIALQGIIGELVVEVCGF